MAEQEPIISFEFKMSLSLFEKLEAMRAVVLESEQEFYLDSVVKGAVIKGLERDGLFVMAVDEDRDTMRFLDVYQEAFEKAETPDKAVKSVEPKILRFRPKGE